MNKRQMRKTEYLAFLSSAVCQAKRVGGIAERCDDRKAYRFIVLWTADAVRNGATAEEIESAVDFGERSDEEDINEHFAKLGL